MGGHAPEVAVFGSLAIALGGDGFGFGLGDTAVDHGGDTPGQGPLEEPGWVERSGHQGGTASY